MTWLLKRYGSPAALRKAGRRKLVEAIRPEAPRMAQRLIDDVFDALDEQTVVVPGAGTLDVVVPSLARSLAAVHEQRRALEARIAALLEACPVTRAAKSGVPRPRTASIAASSAGMRITVSARSKTSAGHCHVDRPAWDDLLVGRAGRGRPWTARAVVQGAPVPGGDHRALRVAVFPFPAVVPRGLGADARTRRARLPRDGPPLVYEVRAGLRRRRVQPGDKWHPDEVFLRINGELKYLWRAGDADGNVLDIVVQDRRDTAAARRFFHTLLKKTCSVPRVIVTDKVRSYGTAHREITPSVEHRAHKGLNNRAENSHQPTRQRERAMKGFRSTGGAQRFLSAFSGI